MKNEKENNEATCAPDKYVLQKAINWFGTTIPQGTTYVQHGKDYYWPVINDAHCPSMQVDFMTVKNNPYFIEFLEGDEIEQLLLKMIRIAFYKVRKENRNI